jgi:hypothetical protein
MRRLCVEQPTVAMGDIINLHRFRKRVTKQRDDERAADNRTLHSRTKSQRVLDLAQKQKSRRDFDAHKIEKGETR